MSNRLITAITYACVCMFSSTGFSHGVGNGGDHIRATFMSLGHAVIQFLDESDAGIQLKEQYQLDSERLAKTLDISVIEVRDGVLLDNLGSVVDAIGVKDKIVLSRNPWADHFQNDRDVYFLVFHEMLRAVEINDDNYTISKSLRPFPLSRRIVTRLANVYPILGQTPLDQIIDAKRMTVQGTGCSQDTAGTFSDIDLERNMLSVYLRRFDLPLTRILAGRKSCTILVPYKAPVGKRLVVSQMDFSAKVALSPNARAAIATDATFGSAAIGLRTKEFIAPSASIPTVIQGRLFLRSNTSVSTGCEGSAGLLKIRAAGSIQKPEVASADLNFLIGDSLAVSFVIEDCITKSSL